MENRVAKQRILIVEDEPLLRRALIHRLTLAGYEVISAHNGREALDWLDSSIQKFGIVLLDMLMPQYSGLEVLQKIRSLPYKLPVILMSQADELIAREAIQESKPDAFLAKPFQMEELLTLVSQLLITR